MNEIKRAMNALYDMELNVHIIRDTIEQISFKIRGLLQEQYIAKPEYIEPAPPKEDDNSDYLLTFTRIGAALASIVGVVEGLQVDIGSGIFDIIIGVPLCILMTVPIGAVIGAVVGFVVSIFAGKKKRIEGRKL